LWEERQEVNNDCERRRRHASFPQTLISGSAALAADLQATVGAFGAGAATLEEMDDEPVQTAVAGSDMSR
jgi:hypothetical protein